MRKEKGLQVSYLPRRSFRNFVLLVRGFCWFTENIVILQNRLVLRVANAELPKIHLSYTCNRRLNREMQHCPPC